MMNIDLAEVELHLAALFAGNKCVECGSTAHTLVDGTVIYPHRKDLAMLSFWKCSCGAYVGCHKGTTTPLGSPAGEEVRRLRRQCHAIFDPLWRELDVFSSRSAAYAWLSNELGFKVHFSQLNKEQCRKAIDTVAKLVEEQQA